ncbi:Uncharacterised protein [Mycobacteroides abscessus subsp. abscessus]|nr:Uncharacterised protein [Mycobacteroides abscessus subsp. abscessus]
MTVPEGTVSSAFAVTLPFSSTVTVQPLGTVEGSTSNFAGATAFLPFMTGFVVICEVSDVFGAPFVMPGFTRSVTCVLFGSITTISGMTSFEPLEYVTITRGCAKVPGTGFSGAVTVTLCVVGSSATSHPS